MKRVVRNCLTGFTWVEILDFQLLVTVYGVIKCAEKAT